jgi:NAD(P)-dependent dehydrogenase (short-subunit alcohol dehydrogenase family)
MATDEQRAEAVAGRRGGLRVFDGAAAIVTGGASGIGLALGRALAARGCEVVLADLQGDLAAQGAESIRARGGKASGIELDVTDAPAVERLVRETARRTGRLDYMFNNAGIGIGGETRCLAIADWQRIIDVNLRGVVNGVQPAYQLMHRQGFGHIVNTASVAGLGPAPMQVAYSATKHAVVGLSLSLRIEAAPAGVRVSVLCPGLIRTAILDGGRFGKVVGDLSRERMRQFTEGFSPMDADLFARKALRGVAADRAIIVVPFRWRVMWWICRLSPGLGLRVSRALYRKACRELGIGPGAP